MKHSTIVNLPVPQIIVTHGHKCYTQIGWCIIDFNSKKEFKSYFPDSLFDVRFENNHGYIYIVNEDGEKIDEDDKRPTLAKILFENQKEDLTLMREYPITSEYGITMIRKSEFKVLFSTKEVITKETIRKTLNAQRLFYMDETVDYAINPQNANLLPLLLSKFNLTTKIDKLILNVSVDTGDEEPVINSLFWDNGQYLYGEDNSSIFWPEGLFPKNTTYEMQKNAFISFLKDWEEFAKCEVELNVEWDCIDDPIKEPKITAFKNSIREEIERLKENKK